MNRMYVDISHFRAPYKNWPTLNGFGADTTPIDASTPVPVLPAPVDASTPVAPSAPAAALIVSTEPSGVRVLTSGPALLLATLLPNTSVIQVSGIDNVRLDTRQPSDPFRPSGLDWMNQRLAEGKSIVIGADGGLEALFTNAAAGIGNVQSIGLIATTDEAKFAGPGSAFTAILARPTPQQKAVAVQKAGIGMLGVAAIAVLGVGGAVLLFGKKRRS